MNNRHNLTTELNKYECREDDNSGCTFPNNIEQYLNTKENVNKIIKDSICICTPSECACSIEQTDIDS